MLLFQSRAQARRYFDGCRLHDSFPAEAGTSRTPPSRSRRSNDRISPVRSKWMITNYLAAIGFATAGWLYLLVRITMQFV
jgi:hypothetical protein